MLKLILLNGNQKGSPGFVMSYYFLGLKYRYINLFSRFMNKLNKKNRKQ